MEKDVLIKCNCSAEEKILKEKFNSLIGKRVESVGDDSTGQKGILMEITKGRYPFIVKFESGSMYGVTNIIEIGEVKSVDFNLLNKSIKRFEKSEINGITSSEIQNLNIFFDMLSKSSSFAHLAHKEGKRRMVV